VRIGSVDRDGRPGEMSPLDFMDYRDQSGSFVGMAPMQAGESVILKQGGLPAVRLGKARVGASFFSLLGVRAELGRTFRPGEDTPTATRVVILSDATWRRYFAADARIIGQTISLDGIPYVVVGVAPRTLSYPEKPDVWVPFVWQPWEIDPGNRGAHFMFALGRVKAGVSIEHARGELRAIAARLEQEYPRTNSQIGASVQVLQDQIVGDVRPALWAMLGAVAFVLLIACANVANLLLVRAASRESEIAVRTALGAGRLRLVRQLVTESVLLSISGAALGAVIAAWAVDAVVAFGPRGLPRLAEVAIDARMLVFTAAVALATGLLFGLVPALHAARSDVSQMLRERGRGSSHGGTSRTRSMLVILELALAVVLLVGAGLLIRSFLQLIRVDPGFRADRVVAFDAALPDLKYRYDRHVRAFTAELLERLEQLPGTEDVAVTGTRPIDPVAPFGVMTSFDIVGRPPVPPAQRPSTAVVPVSPDFFRTLRIPLIRGRTFTAAEDGPGVPPVVVVNQEFVRRYFPGEDPIGKHIILGVSHDTGSSPADSLRARGEIVGIVGDVKQNALSEQTAPAAYIGYGTLPLGVSIVLRSTANPATVQTAVRQQVREIDPDVAVYNLTTMAEAMAESVSEPRFYTQLLGGFAAIAVTLAALGIYGVISYGVSQRTRELGIRIALGATPRRVVRLVLRSGLLITAIGIGIGIAAALGLTRLIATMLFDVAPADPVTFIVVPVVLVGVALLASWLPARRAAMVDPTIAMRAE
jgi:predicted permease